MNQYFATVARGLEELAAAELTELGATAVTPDFCGVQFQGDGALLYRVNLWARLPFRILQTLTTFPCQTGEDLYDQIYRFDWAPWLSPQATLAVSATGKTRALNHTHFTALQVKNAIVDQQRQRWGQRSTVDVAQPDVQINLHLHRDRATLSLDSSGGSLHRRGYRPAVGQAPLKESLAAALIRLSGWQPEQPFFDPLCGSGTLPIEAAMVALNRAPGLNRDRFGFHTWPNFDPDLWQQCRQDAIAAQRAVFPAFIGGSDGDRAIVIQARSNAKQCDLGGLLQFQTQDLSQVEPPADRGVLMCNPPYGERLGKDSDLGAFYQLLGQVLKTRFSGWTAYVLSGNRALSTAIGLKSSRRWPVYNGTLPCQLLEYELY